jgi:hypothetical protein
MMVIWARTMIPLPTANLHAGIPERVDHVAEQRIGLGGRLPQPDRAGGCGGQARGGEHEQPCLRPSGRGDRRERNGRGRTAQLQRRLPDPEREPALGRLEPAHDRAPARSVHARPGPAGDDEEKHEREVVGVTTEPTLNAASTTPVSVSESPYSSRNCGARTGIPRKTAE